MIINSQRDGLQLDRSTAARTEKAEVNSHLEDRFEPGEAKDFRGGWGRPGGGWGHPGGGWGWHPQPYPVPYPVPYPTPYPAPYPAPYPYPYPYPAAEA